jgi:hypothetical protein
LEFVLGCLVTALGDLKPGHDLDGRATCHSIEAGFLFGTVLASTLGDVGYD